MKKHTIVIAILMLTALTACGSDRYSVEVGPMATPAAQPAPQVIVIQQPAAQPEPASDGTAGVVLALAMLTAAAIGALTFAAIAWIWSHPHTQPPQPPQFVGYLPPHPEQDVPLINTVNHYHYHATPPAEMPSGWSVARKAEHLINAGYTVDQARNIIDQQHRAKQLPPAR